MKFQPFLGLLLTVFLLAACTGSKPASQTPSNAPVSTAPKKMESNTSSFYKSLSLQGVTFNVSASGGKLTVTPSGLTGSNEPITQNVAGTVYNAEVEDLNSDGSPDLFVYARSGAMDNATVYAFSTLRKSSMVMVSFPDIRNHPAGRGYNGKDEFAVVETSLSRRFPVYENGRLTGKTRQVVYKLRPGENMPVLEIDRFDEY